MAQEFDIVKLSQYIINKKGIVWIQDEPIRSFGYKVGRWASVGLSVLIASLFTVGAQH